MLPVENKQTTVCCVNLQTIYKPLQSVVLHNVQVIKINIILAEILTIQCNSFCSSSVETEGQTNYLLLL